MFGKWVRNSSIVGAIVAAGMIAATPGVAAPGAALPALPTAAEQISFWAQPFPSGYRWRSSSCYRHVKVETSRGMRTRRVWVCR